MNDEQAIILVDKIMFVIEKFAYVGDGEKRDEILNALYGILKDLK